MIKSDKDTSRPPYWFSVILLFMSLPLLGYPLFWAYIRQYEVVSVNDGMMKFILYALPVYVVASQWMSYWIYRERKSLAWILQGVLLMVYIFCVWLVYYVGAQ